MELCSWESHQSIFFRGFSWIFHVWLSEGRYKSPAVFQQFSSSFHGRGKWWAQHQGWIVNLLRLGMAMTSGWTGVLMVPLFWDEWRTQNQLPNQAGDMQGIFLDLKWSRSLYQPLSYRKTPNGVKLHVFSAREHQQAIISGDGVFPQIFELFPVLSLKIVFLLPQSYGSLCGPSLFLFKWPQPCG